jgi:hypothetical protein
MRKSDFSTIQIKNFGQIKKLPGGIIMRKKLPELEVGMTFKTREMGMGVIVPDPFGLHLSDDELENPIYKRNLEKDGRYWADDFCFYTYECDCGPSWDIMELYKGNKLVWKRGG